MLVACLILHCCLLVVYILVRLDLLSNTLLRAVRFMLLLTSWFFLRLCIFLVVVDVFTHEHLASEDVINKSHRRLTWSHRLDFILELLCCKQIGFRLVAMLCLSEVIGWIWLRRLGCQTYCLLILALEILLIRIVVGWRLESFFLLGILRSEELLLHLPNGVNRAEIAASCSIGSIDKSWNILTMNTLYLVHVGLNLKALTVLPIGPYLMLLKTNF